LKTSKAILQPLLLMISGSFVFAAAPKFSVDVVTTDHVDMPASGVIRIENSYGELNIESWEGPQVEIVVTRSAHVRDTQTERDRVTRELNAIHITSATEGSDLVIRTPRYRRFHKEATLDYRIMVPRTARLLIHHNTGDVLIGNVGGDIDAFKDIDASVKVGDILLRLPRTGTYSFDAECREGGIVSDFAGTYSRHHLIRENFTTSNTAAKRIHLHVGIGGIQIQAMEQVVTAAPLTP
jgi:hypothetical protein